MTTIKFGFSWKNILWRKFREKLYLLQTQIFTFIKDKNFKKALFKQKCLLLSSEIYYLSIRQITQLRLDRKIPGVDEQLIKLSSERLHVFRVIKEKLCYWTASPIWKIYLIDFLKGKTLLFVPTIFDRIVQYIWGLALEPVFNTLFFENQISLSSPYKYLFVKYAVILKLISNVNATGRKWIYVKCDIFSHLTITFNRNFLLKVLFFPDIYKKVIVDSLNFTSLSNLNSNNENLKFYLYTFHYFVISFGFFSFKDIISKKISLYFSFSVNFYRSNFHFYYFNQIVYFLNINQNESVSLALIKSMFSKTCLFSMNSEITKSYSFLRFEFLDWHFRLLNTEKYVISPCYITWFNYKNRFKRILKITKYNVYQKIKLLEMFVQSRLLNNWFCRGNVFKKEYYILKIWFNKYIRTFSNFHKVEKEYFSKRVFSSFKNLDKLFLIKINIFLIR